MLNHITRNVKFDTKIKKLRVPKVKKVSALTLMVWSQGKPLQQFGLEIPGSNGLTRGFMSHGTLRFWALLFSTCRQFRIGVPLKTVDNSQSLL